MSTPVFKILIDEEGVTGQYVKQPNIDAEPEGQAGLDAVH